MNKFWEQSLPPGYYDKILIEGLKKGRGIQPNWHNTTFKKVKSLLKDHEAHLDYACGPGTFVGNYSNCHSISVDIAKNQINFANKKYQNKGTFIHLDDFEFHKYTEKFDVITIMGLFEFLTDEELIELVDNLFQILKPGGRLISTTLNFKSSLTILLEILESFSAVSYREQHVNKLSKKRLEKLLLKSKYHSVSITKFINFGLFFSIFSIRLGSIANSFIEKISKNYIGYLLLVELKK